MPEAVRDLLAAAAEPPTRPVDPVALRRRAHRRSRTAGAGAASLALVLVSVVAVAGLGGPGLSRVALEEAAPSIPPSSTAVGQERLNSVSGTAVPEIPAGDSPPGTDAPTGRPPAPAAGPQEAPAPGPAPAPVPESPTPPAVEGPFPPPPPLGPPEPSASPVRPAPESAVDGAPAAPAPEVLGEQPVSSRTVALPTHDEAEIVGAVHGATVAGDGSRDGGCVWLVVAGRPRAVRWEAGSTARFGVAGDGSETVEVLDGAGNVVARGGEAVTVVARERPGRLDRCHVGDEAVVWHVAVR